MRKKEGRNHSRKGSNKKNNRGDDDDHNEGNVDSDDADRNDDEGGSMRVGMMREAVDARRLLSLSLISSAALATSQKYA